MTLYNKISRRYKRTKIGGLTDLANVVDTSANVNTTQLTGTPDGRVIVPTYDWQTLYEHTKKLVGIKSFHHLRFSSTSKGHVFARLKSDSPEVDYNLLKDKWSPTATVLPERLTPSGLNPARQWYLFQKIREFCPEEAKDVPCLVFQRRPAHLPPAPLPPLPQASLLPRKQGFVASAGKGGTMPAHVQLKSSFVYVCVCFMPCRSHIFNNKLGGQAVLPLPRPYLPIMIRKFNNFSSVRQDLSTIVQLASTLVLPSK